MTKTPRNGIPNNRDKVYRIYINKNIEETGSSIRMSFTREGFWF